MAVCSVEASHLPLGMHLEKVMLVQQLRALEIEEQTVKCRKSNRERVGETRALETEHQTANCRKFGECSTDSLLTTHTHYIREGFVRAR